MNFIHLTVKDLDDQLLSQPNFYVSDFADGEDVLLRIGENNISIVSFKDPNVVLEEHKNVSKMPPIRIPPIRSKYVYDFNLDKYVILMYDIDIEKGFYERYIRLKRLYDKILSKHIDVIPLQLSYIYNRKDFEFFLSDTMNFGYDTNDNNNFYAEYIARHGDHIIQYHGSFGVIFTNDSTPFTGNSYIWTFPEKYNVQLKVEVSRDGKFINLFCSDNIYLLSQNNTDHISETGFMDMQYSPGESRWVVGQFQSRKVQTSTFEEVIKYLEVMTSYIPTDVITNI